MHVCDAVGCACGFAVVESDAGDGEEEGDFVCERWVDSCWTGDAASCAGDEDDGAGGSVGFGGAAGFVEDGGGFVVEEVGDFDGDAAGDGGFDGLTVDFGGWKGPRVSRGWLGW